MLSWSILQYFWPALSNSLSWLYRFLILAPLLTLKANFGLLLEWPLKTGFNMEYFYLFRVRAKWSRLSFEEISMSILPENVQICVASEPSWENTYWRETLWMWCVWQMFQWSTKYEGAPSSSFQTTLILSILKILKGVLGKYWRSIEMLHFIWVCTIC